VALFFTFLIGVNMNISSPSPMVYPAPQEIHQGWSKRDIILAVACSVALVANVAFIALTIAPIGSTAAFAIFYKVFAIWSQLSNIALTAVAIITLIHNNSQNYPRLRNFLEPLAL
jgi:hypothetical protein